MKLSGKNILAISTLVMFCTVCMASDTAGGASIADTKYAARIESKQQSLSTMAQDIADIPVMCAKLVSGITVPQKTEEEIYIKRSLNMNSKMGDFLNDSISKAESSNSIMSYPSPMVHTLQPESINTGLSETKATSEK